MHKRGNISILVIFVLLASSLLGILSMNFVQQMIKQSAVVNSYYKAHYLAKAGIELGLAQIKYRGVGFDYVVNTGDAIILDNFLCGANCSISTTLSGTASLLSKKFWQGSGCELSPYVLSSGDSFIMPLFRDVTPGPIANLFTTGTTYKDLTDVLGKIKILPTYPPDMVTFGFLILSGQELYENGIFFRSGSLNTDSLNEFKTAFESYIQVADQTFAGYYFSNTIIANGFKIYLMISNTAQVEQSFCLDTKNDNQLQVVDVLPTNSFFIQSQASYGNQRAGLDASYAQPIPGFLFAL